MKKWILVIFIIIVVIIIGFLGWKNFNKNLTRIGTSKFYIELPEGYVKTKDDFEEDQIAYYYKDDESIDFDVYQWNKEGKYLLEEEANYFAKEYNSTASKVTINGIEGMKYVSKEMYDSNEYTVINYMFDDGDNIIELCFWTVNNEKELRDVEVIINTLTKK